jgi:hypothetical protein
MGMRDESWCNGCGTGIVYTPDEEAYCGNCAYEYGRAEDNRLDRIIEYMKIHLISLQQDADEIQKEMDSYEEMESNEYNALEIEHISLNGQYIATKHLLSVASDILASSNERE